MTSLGQKDQRALMILVISLVLFALIQFVLFPLLAERKQLERRIQSKKNGVVEMRVMQEQLSRLNNKSSTIEQRVAARSPDFSLFAFLEEKCTEVHIKDNISSMKPSDPSGDGAVQQVVVKMKLKAIKLSQLVAFLERIESTQDVVALQRISIQLNKKERGTLDVMMQVITLVQTEMIAS